jgi:hypothetical protein
MMMAPSHFTGKPEPEFNFELEVARALAEHLNKPEGSNLKYLDTIRSQSLGGLSKMLRPSQVQNEMFTFEIDSENALVGCTLALDSEPSLKTPRPSLQRSNLNFRRLTINLKSSGC